MYTLDFFLKRTRSTREEFFKGVLNIEAALLLLKEKDVVSYDLEEIQKIISSNKALVDQKAKSVQPSKKRASTSRAKKPTSKTAKPARKPRTRRKPRSTRKTTQDEKSEKEKSEKDSSYFKTWKVPYVEPE